ITLHHERDLLYYEGENSQNLPVSKLATEYVSGERFEWHELHSPLDDSNQSHFSDSFFVSKLPSDTAGKVATVKFLFRGISSAIGQIVQHVVKIQIGSTSGTDIFNDYNYEDRKSTRLNS